MPDEIFADPRLAAIYDDVDADRSDLALYVSVAEEVGAASVIDVGCGTGTLACLLAGRGLDVIGVDPAAASLAIARSKPGAGQVRWLHGRATDLPDVEADLATMTGNVAQVFLDDDEWLETLAALRRSVRSGGLLVFETRVPERAAWERWTRSATFRRVETPRAGPVETWTDVTEVTLPFVSFRHTYRFLDTDEMLTSHSTLRFRARDEIEASLVATAWTLAEVRDAPDRPGAEYVFLATNS